MIFAVVCSIFQESVNTLESSRTIIIVCVDDRHRAINSFAGRKHCVGGAPWLLTAGRHAVALRQISELLENILDIHILSGPLREQIPKCSFIFLFNDKDGFIKAGHHCVI